MSKRLGQYKHTLTHDQVTEGMNAAIRNAQRLVKDAQLLLDAGRYPSATALAILAIEEAAKTSILRQVAVTRDGKELDEAWRAYRTHTKKNVMWLLPALVGEGANKLTDFRPLFDDASDHPSLLDDVKQISIYTDCLGKAHWSIPEEVIDEKLARNIVRTATILAPKKQIQVKEIELWVKHVGPVWMKSYESMAEAVESWYAEMQDLGLAEDGPNRMSDFIRQGIAFGRRRNPDDEK